MEVSAESLIKAISQRRDVDAFSELMSRYERQAYGLARCITNNHATAEDAVQEAMMDIWLSRSPFEAGNAHGWIMRIVANKSIKQIQRDKRFEKMTTMKEPTTLETSPSTAAESELLSALRGFVGTLPAQDRQLVALYYGGGLTQDEVAAALAIPQRTVSYRLQRLLGELRDKLTRGGFASVPPLSVALFGKAICSSQEAPLCLREKVFERLSSNGSESIRRSRLPKTSAATNWVAPVAFFCGLTALAGWQWYASGGKSAETAPPQSQPASVAPENKPLYARWRFEKGAPVDLAVVAGQWKWLPPSGKTPGMMEVPGSGVVLVPSLKVPASPFVVSVTIRRSGVGSGRVGVFWSNGTEVLARRVSGSQSVFGMTNTQEFYFLKNYSVNAGNIQPVAISTYHQHYPADQICVGVANNNVEEIEIRGLREDEIPKHLRDPESIIAMPDMKSWDVKAAPLAQMLKAGP